VGSGAVNVLPPLQDSDSRARTLYPSLPRAGPGGEGRACLLCSGGLYLVEDQGPHGELLLQPLPPRLLLASVAQTPQTRGHAISARKISHDSVSRVTWGWRNGAGENAEEKTSAVALRARARTGTRTRSALTASKAIRRSVVVVRFATQPSCSTPTSAAAAAAPVPPTASPALICSRRGRSSAGHRRPHTGSDPGPRAD
jgi:hypothetical protein